MKKRSRSIKKRKADSGTLERLPLLPTQDIVALPGLVIPIYITRGFSADAVNEALENSSEIILTWQRGDPEEEPSEDNLCRIAGLAKIIHAVKLSNGDLQIRLHVQCRAHIKKFIAFRPVIRVEAKILEEDNMIDLDEEDEAIIEQVKDNLKALAEVDPAAEEHLFAAEDIFDPGALADLAVSSLPIPAKEMQQVMEELDRFKRLELAAELLVAHLKLEGIRSQVSARAEKEFERAQREEILREHMRQIRAELGEGEGAEDDVTDLKERLAKARMPKAAKVEAEKQLRRLQQMHPDTSEAALARTYLEWLLDVPWQKRSKDRLDLKKAKAILDEDHYGLQKTKERILDFLGVRKLKKDHKGPILLLVGPPGVGKTSLGQSIARALGRKFMRVSLGGLRDEAELRGHRKTYVGAMPGRIIQGLKTCGTKNPVFMLDEIDKVGSDFRGDPSSVLLEVLDPEQNSAFQDHYLNLPYDLSEVMFICTANVTDTIPRALFDRMEVIEISGYTTEEKLTIAKRYLTRWEKKENGLEDYEISFPDEALLHLIEGYTRESGVRELRRHVSTVYRKLARKVAEGDKIPKTLTKKHIEEYLGVVRYSSDERQKKDEVGVSMGLAWTSVGGELLPVEVSITKGKGTMSLTGQMGDVMKESAQAAVTYIMSNAEELDIDPDFYEKANVHVHVPQGAIPKDGPSAGVAIVTALVSALTGRPVSRNVAMTGEITLRGNVIEIGGLREKALAALRIGIKDVIIPKENERELVEFPEYLKKQIRFVPVESVHKALKAALVPDKPRLRDSLRPGDARRGEENPTSSDPKDPRRKRWKGFSI